MAYVLKRVLLDIRRWQPIRLCFLGLSSFTWLSSFHTSTASENCEEMRPSTLFALGLYAALASARGGHDNDHGGGDGDGDGDGTATSSAPSATSTGNVTSGGFGGDLTGLTGDSACNSVSPHLESRPGTNC